jgi:hypothetical protein
MEDRRQSVRVAVPGNLVTVPSAFEVQVLDINVEGVLLRSNPPLAVGTRACLKLNVWGSAFLADVEIRRASPVRGAGPDQVYDVGAVFLSVTPEHRQFIERFAIQ